MLPAVTLTSKETRLSPTKRFLSISPCISTPITPPPYTPKPKRIKSYPTPQYSPGELGKLASTYAKVLQRLGWTQFFQQHHHQTLRSLNPNLLNIPHPAAPYLHRLASLGVPALSSHPPWTVAQQDAAVQRGAHPSATKQYSSFILEDFYDYVLSGYWLVLPYSAIRGHPSLRIAPAGVVPQRDRRPRPIMDYTYNTVNQGTVALAPQRAMQFGTCLQRLLQRLAYANPNYGPPQMAKIDLADGYYRVPVSAHAALQLAVILPSDNLPEPILGIPLSLPMGWKESPPFFCAFTETCTDLANHFMTPQPHHPYHDVVHRSISEPSVSSFLPAATWPHNPHPPTTPLAYVDVYLDDFMALAQPPHMQSTMNNLLHHIHSVFQDPAHSNRRPVVSQSKVLKGDSNFCTTKTLLGWEIDTQAMTIRLPLHRQQRLQALLTATMHKRSSTRRQWQKLLGELHSMTLAIHSAKYLFSILHHVLRGARHRRFRITTLIKHALQDWVHLLQTLHSHPVPIVMTVPHAPHYWAATDASIKGMGGFWLPSNITQDSQPCVWRYPFHDEIQQQIVSQHNLTGSLTNSDLELAAAITGYATQQHVIPPTPYNHTFLATDNTPTQAWVHRGSKSSIGPPAWLLRHLAQTCRSHNSLLFPIFTPGTTNTIADFLSRSFHLTDAMVLHELQNIAPIQPPWKLVTPPAATTSAMNCALLNKKLPEPSLQAVPRALAPPGPYGPTFVSRSPVTLSSTTSKTHCHYSKYSLHDTEWEQLLPPTLRSALERWKAPFVPWGRRSPHWAIKTPGCRHRENLTSDSIGNSKATTKPTHPLHELNPSHF
jgi:hypothetical protein